MQLFTAIFLSFILFSCNSSEFESGGRKDIDRSSSEMITQRFDRALVKTAQPVDIIFGVDTSGSMGTEKTLLQDKMKDFVAAFRASNGSIDYKIILVGSGFSFPQADSQVNVINSRIESTDALGVFVNLFGASGSQKNVIRPEASKHFVVVTDDNADSISQLKFKTMISSNPVFSGKTKVGGLIGMANSKENSWCQIARVGSAYVELAGESKGILKDLCIEDWKSMLTDFASEIISQESVANNEFVLTTKADPSRNFLVKVGETALQDQDFQFEAESNLIKINKEKLTGDYQSVVVSFHKLATN